MSSTIKSTAAAKRHGEKISKGLVNFYLKSGIPTISEIKERIKERVEREKR